MIPIAIYRERPSASVSVFNNDVSGFPDRDRANIRGLSGDGDCDKDFRFAYCRIVPPKNYQLRASDEVFVFK